MMNPLLINKKKFDLRYIFTFFIIFPNMHLIINIRYFVVVPCSKPLFALLYNGFIRKGIYDFDLNI